MFDGQAWKHDSTQIVVTAVIKCLSKKCFLFCGPAWKRFVVYIIRHKCTANTAWRSGLKTLFHGDYWLQLYIFVVHVSYNWVKEFLLNGLAWKHFAVYIMRRASLTARLKNMILWGISITTIIHLKWKVFFVWYQAAMILKPWYCECLLIYIMFLYILLFTLYILYFPVQFSHHNSAFRSLKFSLVNATRSTDGVPPNEAKELWFAHDRTRP